MANLWSKAMASISAGYSAGVQEWRSGPITPELDAIQTRYFHRWLVSRGELSRTLLQAEARSKGEADLYKHITLLWNHAPRVVSFYSAMTYQGQIESVPERGAIPIVPDTAMTEAGKVDDLMLAIWTLQKAWNWQYQMVLRPKIGAATGDVLTELIDDLDRGFVYPQIVWPGKVKDITLDYVGNVLAYVLEYKVVEVQAKGPPKRYTYRKEVDKEWFREYHDDHLYKEYRNPYGFVMAIWDRHESDGMSVRGASSIDKSLDSLMQLNSYFSHAIDYSRKAFFAPVIVDGEISSTANVNLAGPGGDDGSAIAKRFRILQSKSGDKPVAIHQLQFDIGKAEELMMRIEHSILMAHPEATFFDKLAESTQVTGPGADRIILPVKGIVEEVRTGYDWNTVKLFQMAISMCAMRFHDGSWDGKKKQRHEAFAPFSVNSYDNGDLSFTIGQRDIVIPSRAERVALAQSVETLTTTWGLEYADLTPDEAIAVLKEKNSLFGIASETAGANL